MKSFEQYLTEATVSRDQAFVEEAESVLQKIVEDLYVNKQKNIQSNKENTRFLINAGTATKNKLYDNLYVVFGAKDAINMGVFSKVSDKKFNTIGIFTLKPEDYKKEFPVWESLSRDYRLVRSTFIHEFIHYLDSSRIGDDRWTAITKDFTNKYAARVDKKLYFNMPLELNAFYQQASGDIQSTIEKLLLDMTEDSKKEITVKKISKIYAPMFTGNFNDFWKFSVDNFIFQHSFIENLTSDNKKKIMSRYFALYREVLLPKISKLKSLIDNYVRERKSKTNT